jgi:nicotinamidase-related amidase
VVHVRHVPACAEGAPEGAAPAGWEAVLEATGTDPFAGTRLDEELSARGVDALVMAGPMSLGCCEAASHEALARRYRTLVAEDATGAHEQGAAERERVLRERTRAGAEVMSSASIATLLDATAN